MPGLRKRPPLPEEKLFLGGVVDAVGDAVGGAADAVGDAATWTGDQLKSAGTEVGDFIKENPRMIGKIAGTGVGLVVGGPAGMAIGSKIGGMTGKTASKITGDATGRGLKRKRARQALERQRERQRGIRSALSSRLNNFPAMNNASQGRGQNVIATGGFINNYLANGGSVENMEQDAKKIKGPKHEKGGVHLNPNTEVEGGETMDKVNGQDYVFSDRLTVPSDVLPDGKKGMTFSKYHEYLVENGANKSTIQELAEIQERVAGRDGHSAGNKGQEQPNQKMKHLGPLGQKLNMLNQSGQRKMSKGGEKKYKSGGDVDYQDGGFLGTMSNVLGDQYNAPGEMGLEYYTGQDPTSGGNTSGGSGFMSQAGNFAESALPYLPAIMNVGRGLLEDSEVPDVPYTPPAGRAEQTIRQMDTDIDVSDQLASVDRSLRSIIADPNASMTQKRAAASTAAQQRAKIEGQEERRETSLQNEMMSRLASAQQRRDQAIASGRTQAAQAERRQQMKADEAQMNLIQTGLQQAGQRYQQQQRWEDKLDMDAMSLASELAAVPNEEIRTYVLDMLSERFPGKATRVRNIMNNQ